ncbi:Phasin [Burkholderia multivorans]
MTVFAPDDFMANFKSGIAAWFASANPALQGFEAVIELHAQATRAALAECEDHLRAALGSTNPVELLTQQLNTSQRVVGKVASYGCRLLEITANTQTDCTKVAQTHYQHFNKHSKEWLAHLTNHASASSETVVAAMNSALSSASAAAVTIRAATGQVIEIAQSGFEAVAASTQNVEPTSARANGTRKESAARETA